MTAAEYAQTAFLAARLVRAAAPAPDRWGEGAGGHFPPGLPSAGAAAQRPLEPLGFRPLVDQSQAGCLLSFSNVSLRTAKMLSKGNTQEENVPERGLYLPGRLGFAGARAGRVERTEDGPADSAWPPAALISTLLLLSLRL